MGTKTLSAIRKRARRRIRDLVAGIFKDEKIDELAYYEALEHGPIKLMIGADPAWNVTRVRLLKPKKVCLECGGIGWKIWPEAPADRCKCNPETPEAPQPKPKPVPTEAEAKALLAIHAHRRPNREGATAAYDRGWLRRVAVQGDTSFGRGYYELTKPGREIVASLLKAEALDELVSEERAAAWAESDRREARRRARKP